MKVLDENEIHEFCETNGITYENDELRVIFNFQGFENVSEFITKLIPIISSKDHHPTVEFDYSTVTIATTTHDEGNKITDLDIELLEACIALSEEYIV